MMISRAMGARQPGPQGERAISVKTIAQGMPDDSAEPVVPSPCFFYARGPWVAASTRHSLRPLRFQRVARFQDSGALRRETANTHAQLFVIRIRRIHVVIARRKAPKQSRVVCVALDCFAEPAIRPRFARTGWLAMT